MAIFLGTDSNDFLVGGDEDDSLFGEAGDDILQGNSGDDLLVGGAGSDRMEGGAGNDFYSVDSLEDSVIEAVGGGIDTVLSWNSYALGAHVENLQLLMFEESNALTGTGNALDNTIRGNEYGNRLVGGGGDDVLIGYGGGDILIGGRGDDVLVGYDPFYNPDSGFETGQDVMKGGRGADRFDLDGSHYLGLFYGDSDVLIQDFNAREGDKIQVNVLDREIGLNEYTLEVAYVVGSRSIADTTISYEGQRVAVVKDQIVLDPSHYIVVLDENLSAT